MVIGETVHMKRLRVELGAAYLEMVSEFVMVGEGYPYNNIPLARQDMAAIVRELDGEEAGIGLPDGIVPQTTFVLVGKEGTVFGEIRFRPTTEAPFGPGRDHIGYNARPSARGQGYAGVMLGLVLAQARLLGLDGVALTVEGENGASVRVIERAGGTVVDDMRDHTGGERTRVYWIPVPLKPDPLGLDQR